MGKINMCLVSSWADFTAKPLLVKVFFLEPSQEEEYKGEKIDALITRSLQFVSLGVGKANNSSRVLGAAGLIRGEHSVFRNKVRILRGIFDLSNRCSDYMGKCSINCRFKSRFS